METSKARTTILLGAGFSKEKNYPLGSELLEKLKNLDRQELLFSDSGKLCISAKGKGSIRMDNPYQYAFEFLLDIIDKAKELEGFTSETLYDSIEPKSGFKSLFDLFDRDYLNMALPYIERGLSHIGLISLLPIVYNQLLEHIIGGEANEHWYEMSRVHTLDEEKDYSDFLRFLQSEVCNNKIIDVFTLNHDLVFESFKNVMEIGVHICDGFDDYGSDIYGLFKPYQDCQTMYRCRLERYTGRYTKPIRLYKLHGSFNYALYHKLIKVHNKGVFAVPYKYVKLKHEIEPEDLHRAIGRKMRYEESGGVTCSSFLTGEITKYLRYKDKLLYEKLQKYFKNSLQKADKLIVIGYGANDSLINCVINKYCKANRKYVINPIANEIVTTFVENIGATFIPKTIEEVVFTEL